jgi:hypothetical protein
VRTVAVDFDGVLHSYTSGWTGYRPLDGPEPGALAFVEGLIGSGYAVVVMSSRADHPAGVAGIRGWLAEHGFPALRVTNLKVAAVAYIDDRGVGYRGTFDGIAGEVDRLASRQHGGNSAEKLPPRGAPS